MWLLFLWVSIYFFLLQSSKLYFLHLKGPICTLSFILPPWCTSVLSLFLWLLVHDNTLLFVTACKLRSMFPSLSFPLFCWVIFRLLRAVVPVWMSGSSFDHCRSLMSLILPVLSVFLYPLWGICVLLILLINVLQGVRGELRLHREPRDREN